MSAARLGTFVLFGWACFFFHVVRLRNCKWYLTVDCLRVCTGMLFTCVCIVCSSLPFSRIPQVAQVTVDRCGIAIQYCGAMQHFFLPGFASLFLPLLAIAALPLCNLCALVSGIGTMRHCQQFRSPNERCRRYKPRLSDSPRMPCSPVALKALVGTHAFFTRISIVVVCVGRGARGRSLDFVNPV